MAALSLRALFKLLALLLPAALLSGFLGSHTVRASTLEIRVNAGDIGRQAQLWTVGRAHDD